MLRVCPKLMKVLTGFIALLPVLWATTPGVGPMTPVAIPVIGSAAAPGIHVLRLVPVYYISLRTVGAVEGIVDRWRHGIHGKTGCQRGSGKERIARRTGYFTDAV